MTQYGWDNCPEPVSLQGQRFTSLVAGLLADNLVGVYLHGSLTMHCSNPQHSDLDLLVFSRHPMPVHTKHHLAERLLTMSGAPCPIETSVVLHADLVTWHDPV